MSDPSLASPDSRGNPPADEPPGDAPRVVGLRLYIRVLGGSFHVSQVLLRGGRSPEEMVAEIEAVPPERWFVMVADHQETGRDALAMVDDDLELRICAHGTLVQD